MKKIVVIVACAAFCFGFASYGNFQGLEVARRKTSNAWKFLRRNFQCLELFSSELPSLGSFREIPGGTFSMGSREGRSNEQPRDASVAPFRMLDHEVTVKEFKRYRSDYKPALPGNTPAAFVTYDDALGYCEWLSSELNAEVRLPTEEEWEYAARGGIRKARYPWGWNPPDGRAQYGADSACKVRSHDPNPFGLYDMSGNVFEWCASSNDFNAVARGGAWAETDPAMLTVFRRTTFPKNYADADVGFRVVIPQPSVP